MRKNLLVVRAGEPSMHPEWDDGSPRNFDLMVSYYHPTIEPFEDDSEYQHRCEGPPWKGNADVCKKHAELLTSYDFVAFADDDILTTYTDMSRLFDICSWYGLSLATPAITVNSVPDLEPRSGLLLRYMDRCDLICPVFGMAALVRLMSTFSESQSGWGLPHLWAHMCARPFFTTAVVDDVVVRHMRPFSGGRLQAGGVNPLKEQYEIFTKYGLKPADRRFFGEVPLFASR